jgi:hypothetical protein
LSARFEIELSFRFILVENTYRRSDHGLWNIENNNTGSTSASPESSSYPLPGNRWGIVVHKRDINTLETQLLGTPVKGASILKLYSLLCFNEVLAALKILYTTHVNLPSDYLAEKIETIP